MSHSVSIKKPVSKVENWLDELEKKCRGNKNKFVEKDILFIKNKIIAAFTNTNANSEVGK